MLGAILSACDLRSQQQAVQAVTPQAPVTANANATVAALKQEAGKDMEGGYHAKAIEKLNKALQLNPQEGDTYVQKGFAHLYAEEYDQARIDFSQADGLGYQDKTFLAYANGLSYQWAGEAEKAIEEYDKAILLGPQKTFGYQGRGQSYIDRGDYKLAISDFNVLLQIDPKSVGGRVDRAVAYGHIQQYDAAFRDFADALKLEPENAYIFLGRAKVYVMMGDKNKAKTDVTKALEQSSDVRIQLEGKQLLDSLDRN